DIVDLKERRGFLVSSRMYLDELTNKLIHNFSLFFMEKKQKVSSFAQRLSDLNPTNILKRGFSITIKKSTKEVVWDAKQVDRGEEISVYLHRGQLECSVDESIR
ncbi:MAG TPA: exodeoxyribonuclease VII large subunit, partial [Syntrophorhabdaceae bacterium]|nr:exodeoxyribonuclease VII large subunit [Syntrophorhabdaceae bacterium]